MLRRVAVAAAVALGAALLTPATAVADTAGTLADRTVKCRNDLRDADRITTRIASSRPGDEIVLDGPCLINRTIKLLGDRAYRGESRTGTVISAADNANLDAIFASDSYLDNSPVTGNPFSLRSMTIYANAATNPRGGDAVIVRSWQTVLEDLQIEGARRHAIHLTSRSADGTELTNTQVNGRIIGNQLNDSGGSGLYVDDPGNSITDWQFRDNYVAGTGGDGVSMDNAAGWFVTGNHIYGVGGDTALRADRLFGTSIGDNYIENFGTVGIAATVQGDAASTIANNRIFNFVSPTGTFLRVAGRYGRPVVAVTGNTIRGAGVEYPAVGLDYARGGADSMTVTSTGNSVTDVATPHVFGPGVVVNAGS